MWGVINTRRYVFYEYTLCKKKWSEVYGNNCYLAMQFVCVAYNGSSSLLLASLTMILYTVASYNFCPYFLLFVHTLTASSMPATLNSSSYYCMYACIYRGDGPGVGISGDENK